MSKAWDLSCTCKNEYESCPYCIDRYPSTARGRFERELDRAAGRVGKEKLKMSADWLSDDKKSDTATGYHLDKFPRGVYGESSKIYEEVLELQDAEKQGARIMALHELSDILGAIDGYREKHYPDIKFDDLVKMFRLTQRAFKSGHRK